jgi:hypothetical protein
MSDQPVQGCYLHTGQNKRRINTQTYTYMPRVGFEPTIPAFEQAETIHALDREATVIVNEGVWRSGCIGTRFLYLGTIWN